MSGSDRAARTIKIAAAIWAGGILLSRFVGLARDAVVGRVLGAGGDADVYFAAFTLPDFLNYLLASGALSLVFIPMFGGYLARGEEDAGWRIFSILFNFLLIAMGLAVVVAMLLTPLITPEVAPGFSEARMTELVRVTRILIPAQLFHVLGGLLGATLMAKDRHTWPAMAPTVYTLGIIAGGLALGPRLGAEGFAWGVLAGSARGPFGLNLVGCLRAGLRWRPTLDLGHPDFRRYLWLSLPIMLAFSVIAVDDWVLKRLGSTLGEGVVAKITYGKTLMKVPMGVFGLAVGAASFPTISRLVAAGKRGEAYRTLIRACRAMLVMAFAAQAGLTVAGAEVAEVIFGTGRFSPTDLAEIGAFTGLFCLGLWGWAAQTVVARGFYAMSQTWAPSLLGTAIMAGFYPLYVALGDALGPRGLVIASSVAISTYVVILALWLRRSMPDGPTEAGIFGVVLRMAAAVAVGVAGGEGVELLVADWPALLRGGLSGGLAAAVALAVAQLIGVGEVREVVDRVWGKIRRKLGR